MDAPAPTARGRRFTVVRLLAGSGELPSALRVRPAVGDNDLPEAHVDDGEARVASEPLAARRHAVARSRGMGEGLGVLVEDAALDSIAQRSSLRDEAIPFGFEQLAPLGARIAEWQLGEVEDLLGEHLHRG